MPDLDKAKIIEIGRRTLQLEEQALKDLSGFIDDNFVAACGLLLNCQGRVVVIGLGKSGHVARKIAATLASTGTPSFFVHSAEAGHGDLGMITKQDVAVMISYSGKSEELIRLLPMVKRLDIKMIAITGDQASPLAQAAEVVIPTTVAKEACPLGLAPTSSTTATLAMGDALAVAVLEARGFTADDFAFSHPSGALGRKLLLKVADVMHSGDEIPQVAEQVTIDQALMEVTSKRLGMTTVLDAQGKLIGVFTDGDLRRCLDKKVDIHQTSVAKVMTKKFTTIKHSELSATALKLMDDKKINSMPVVDDQGNLVGALNMHDLLKAGVI